MTATMRQLLRAAAVVTFVVIIAAPPSTLRAIRQIQSPPDSPLTLWYREPANEWVEALPIGNGRLAGMVFGGIEHERIQLNEDTLWAGGPYDPANPQALEALPIARRLIFAGKYGEAHALVAEKMLGRPCGRCHFSRSAISC
jgi:alpha-L-fucosidase 2